MKFIDEVKQLQKLALDKKMTDALSLFELEIKPRILTIAKAGGSKLYICLDEEFMTPFERAVSGSLSSLKSILNREGFTLESDSYRSIYIYW